MKKSLHIGINNVDNNNYGFNIPLLYSCENDAINLKNISKLNDFETTLLLSSEATYTNIISYIKESAKQLKLGDSLLITYSGHGSQIKDLNSDENDGLDEFFVLYDQPFFDDELHSLFALFKEGVKIITICDCCHSGTITRNKKAKINRFLSDEISKEIFNDKKKTKQIKTRLSKLNNEKEIKAGIISLSACNDKQLAGENKNNGYFTESLIKLINQKLKTNKRLTPTYIIRQTRLILKSKNQTPQLNKYGIIPRSFLLTDILQ